MSLIDTLIVGAGHSGLAMSALLREAGREHLVLERRDRLGGGWQDRWEAFRLVTPNWTASFPGWEYDGPDPDGFMTRDEIAGRVARYAEVVDAPVALGVEVQRLTPLSGGGLEAATNDGELRAREVVVATGSYHVPRIPAAAAGVAARVMQLHAHDYRTERVLPAGAVLVVGSGQTGVQLAEELFAAGRTVYLSVGSAGRLPRRYRGRDIFGWLVEVADQLPAPPQPFNPMPALSGQDGGHDTNLRQFALDGIRLAGRLTHAAGERLTFAGDLPRNLAAADRMFDERFKRVIDTYIERAGIAAPPDDRVAVDHEPAGRTELDLRRAGIGTIIWATGYGLDYAWIAAPIVDERGYPSHVRGVSPVPGLSFLGLLWQRSQASASLVGPGLDGPHLITRARRPARAF